MDASASPKVDLSDLTSYFFKIENTTFPTSRKQKSPVIKYTKLPDFDSITNVSWPQHSYTLQPRLRRIISFEDHYIGSPRSLSSKIEIPTKMQPSTFTKRKIVTIVEDDESDAPKICREYKKLPVNKASSTAGPNYRREKITSQRCLITTRNSKESKTNTKQINTVRSCRKDTTPQRSNLKTQQNSSNFGMQHSEKPGKTKISNYKDITHTSKSAHASPTISFNKKHISPSGSAKEVSIIKNKLTENLRMVSSLRKSENYRNKSPPPRQNQSKASLIKEIKSKHSPVTIIRVPLDKTPINTEEIEKEIIKTTKKVNIDNRNMKNDCGTDIDGLLYVKDMKVGTEPLPLRISQSTEIDHNTHDLQKNNTRDSSIQTESISGTSFQKKIGIEKLDSLNVPNVSLTKEQIDEPKEDLVRVCSQSLPNLNVPTVKITTSREINNEDDKQWKSASYVISRAVLTYTTQQKVNFHLMDNNNKISQEPSSPLIYPINVVSIYKKQLKNAELSDINRIESKLKEKSSKANCLETLNELNSFNCSYNFNSDKLVKPSDIISTIRVNNDLLQSDYICEQFQRELNFIDSFFESLQYLENCSLSDKCFQDKKVEKWVSKSGFDVRNPEYSSFFSNLENDTNVEDSETMATKSLCLLNLLIRDEQRRAKNLLFVLKMREDALKDFTKSQILWLENKKKQDNTDISTLKKKQRGALLKLQHECGEMQRMRKALLALSEKRKVALMKTKKDIELKLKNDVNVEQILLGKKKLKRNTTFDRNTAPLKCFDLSSSGCDDSATSRTKSCSNLIPPEALVPVTVESVEKSIQAGDSTLQQTPRLDQATDTAAENFVVVDGGYLNILFNNLSLPEIFSSGKQYEVNEEALKNIVNSTNAKHSYLSDSDVVEKFMDQIKNRDLDRSSTPSTARSLVEEFDQYYKVLEAEEKLSAPYNLENNSGDLLKLEFKNIDANVGEKYSCHSASTMTSTSSDTVLGKTGEDQSFTWANPVYTVDSQSIKTAIAVSQAGPLPVPVGAAFVDDTPAQSKSSIDSPVSTASSQSLCNSETSMSSLTSPVHCEAEELRRQQLAIEREIKALEQQQCQLLVVREIPDKPPPPYTPPTDAKSSKTARIFVLDENIEQTVHRHITEPDSFLQENNDSFDLFIKDFCGEVLETHKIEESDKPWDACNLLPQKPHVDIEKLVTQTSLELKEALTSVTPTVVSGVGARRSDHVDDILFAEWKRCEPEWTALHTDEAIVKNQIFENIFQKILTETVDEYKKIVLRNIDLSE